MLGKELALRRFAAAIEAFEDEEQPARLDARPRRTLLRRSIEGRYGSLCNVELLRRECRLLTLPQRRDQATELGGRSGASEPAHGVHDFSQASGHRDEQRDEDRDAAVCDASFRARPRAEGGHSRRGHAALRVSLVA